MKKSLIILCSMATALLLPVFSFAGSATISWNANADDDLAGYRIYYSTTKGGPYGSSTALIPKTQTSYTITNLSNGTYYFVVTALDTSNNESINSIEVTKTIASTSATTATNTAPTAATTPPTTTTQNTSSGSSTTKTTGSTSTVTTTSSASASQTKTASASATPAAPTGTASSPIPLPATGQYGNKISGNASKVQEVNFIFSGRTGDVNVYYTGYDVNSKTELSILVNGQRVGYAKKTKKKKWGANRSITVEDSFVNDSGTNILTFRNKSSAGRWGVTRISVN
jgi:hypothetical protein